MVRLQEAVDRVREHLRLGEADAAIYVQLVVAGASKVSDVAEALHLHRNDVYRAVERLLERGLVRDTHEKPARYAALEPELAFDAEVEARFAAIESLRATRENLGALQAHLRVAPAQPPRNTYKVIEGRREIHTVLRRLVEEATVSVDWATTFPTSIRLWESWGMLDTLRARVSEGIEARLLVRADPAAVDALDPFLGHAHASVRRFDAGSIVRFVVIDAREVLMFVTNDESEAHDAPGDVAIHTTADAFVEAQSLFFQQAWASAPPVLAKARLGPARGQASAPALGRIEFPGVARPPSTSPRPGIGLTKRS